ncbi:MAG TPA: FAD:protein FMN transferase [Gaiellaceae bacterium]|nr:FAD:protein FMN transferase [Gaiellaceae bacterium]
MTASLSFEALGTTASVVVTHDEQLDAAVDILAAELRAIDLACSRFRKDSELARVNAYAGELVPISDLFAAALRVALDAADTTNGLVDPTLGANLRNVGYDRTFSLIRERDNWAIVRSTPKHGRWREIELNEQTVRIPLGCELDLGATAKAFAADRAAERIARRTGSATLVSLGGDVATAGAPDGGWCIRLAEDHTAPLDSPGPCVCIENGGLATSSTAVRRWQTDSGEAHHLLDPRTGRPADSPWRTVSVAASSCVDANIASTAAIVLGDSAPRWLAERGLPARLVANDGGAVHVFGWPSDELAVAA